MSSIVAKLIESISKVPVGQYFIQKYVPESRQLMARLTFAFASYYEIIPVDIAEDFAKFGKLKTVMISQLIPTQSTIDEETVNNSVSEEPPHVFSYGGSYYVRDGHHRIATAVSIGMTELPVYVCIIKKSMLN